MFDRVLNTPLNVTKILETYLKCCDSFDCITYNEYTDDIYSAESYRFA